MYYGILASLYRAFVFSTYMDLLCITSYTHLFFIAYRYLHAMWQWCMLESIICKFDNGEKIFFSIIEYQKH